LFSGFFIAATSPSGDGFVQRAKNLVDIFSRKLSQIVPPRAAAGPLCRLDRRRFAGLRLKDFRMLADRDVCREIDSYVEGTESAQYQAQFGARLAILYLDQPFPAGPGFPGERGLIHPQLDAARPQVRT
jgi:hypothetical protein